MAEFWIFLRQQSYSIVISLYENTIIYNIIVVEHFRTPTIIATDVCTANQPSLCGWQYVYY